MVGCDAWLDTHAWLWGLLDPGRVERMVQALPRREAPLTHQIAATAKVMGLTLVTADAQLLRSKEYAVLANR